MKTIVSFLALAFTLAAQQTVTTSQVFTYGPWAQCQTSTPVTIGLCAGFVPGSAQYLLGIVSDTGAPVVAYTYSVTAYLAETDAMVTVTGVVQRSSSGATFAVLNFGGVATSTTVTVQDLVVLQVNVSAKQEPARPIASAR